MSAISTPARKGSSRPAARTTPSRFAGLCPHCHGFLCEHSEFVSECQQPPPSLLSLDDDTIAAIALACGSSLPAFASTCSAVRRVTQRQPMWRQAYVQACGECDEDDEWLSPSVGDCLPESMWRTLLVRSARLASAGAK